MEELQALPTNTNQLLNDKQSGKKLQVAIFNLVSLGEWEAASSILKSLAIREDTRLTANQLIRALIVGANDYW